MVDIITQLRQAEIQEKGQTRSFAPREQIFRGIETERQKERVRVSRRKSKKKKTVIQKLQTGAGESTFATIEKPVEKKPTKIISTYTAAPTPTRFQKISRAIGRVQKPKRTKTRTEITLGTLAFYADVGIGVGKGLKGTYQTITSPIRTAKGLKAFATDKQVRKQVFQSAGQTVKSRPGIALGSALEAVYTPSAVGKVSDFAKGTYVKVGTKYVPTEKVFSSKVLQGKETLPKTKSVAESLKRFDATKDAKGNVFLQTASPEKLKGKVAGVGKKAGLGLEDPGIYVTPAKEGSPFFLRIADDSAKGYSFNPITPIIDLFKTPTVTVFKAKGVKTLPKSVIEKAGFKAVAEFQKKQAGKGLAYITKRSMLGQGEIKPKTFKTPAGKKVKEAGTSEIEAVIPVGEKIKYTPKTVLGKLKGFDEYTMFQGKPVAIRKAELVPTKKIKDIKTKGKFKSVEVKRSKIKAESSAISKPKPKPVYKPVSKVISYVKPSSLKPSKITVSRPKKYKKPSSSVVPKKPSKITPSKISSKPITPKSSAKASYKSKPLRVSRGYTLKGKSYTPISKVIVKKVVPKKITPSKSMPLTISGLMKKGLPQINLKFTRTIVRPTKIKKAKLFNELKLYTGAELR